MENSSASQWLSNMQIKSWLMTWLEQFWFAARYVWFGILQDFTSWFQGFMQIESQLMTWMKQFWLAEILLNWGLAGFHFLVPRLFANLVLAHDLIETVLIGCKICSIWDLAGFHLLVHRHEGFPCVFTRALWYSSQLAGSHLDVKLHSFVDSPFGKNWSM